ncbi:glycosyltransferase family 4 protein [Leptolyngbya sp. FACHB-16]|uniref:glycosyltransferase family 4 protein n=1 Tax=unclassified Leptolyngbya TaxID=2650499 RepID=UPI001682DEB1|nr:glycosyltransferase family 4 protein [Leptolyngbya sp. FACHB-16]MBD2157417.1 glycosyltransferase family 4 protein [Leptolyngbya sp. FACHB-16]
MKRARAHWICCQLGAREHYSIPRALHAGGLLGYLMTDAWVLPSSLRLPLPGMQRLADRYHPELQNASLKGFTADLLRFEAMHRLRKTDAWTRILARNDWFQRRAIAHLQHTSVSRPILFSYSYAALKLGRFAKQRGWSFVLGQIDPGRKAEQQWQPFPVGYWESWLEECQLADRIIVNSPWSAQWLQAEGIPAEKLVLLPLVYEPEEAMEQFQRRYPEQFSPERPLRVLFLGQAIARKGIQELLQAAHRLADQPIQFILVGAADPDLVAAHRAPNLCWVGAVPRSATAAYYQQADIFLFPTHSDGFGLTQLEAQAWKLPLIASRCCGAVVQDQVNGLVLPEVSPEAIAQFLLTCLQEPQRLAQFAAHSGIAPQFRMDHLRQHLCHLSTELS